MGAPVPGNPEIDKHAQRILNDIRWLTLNTTLRNLSAKLLRYIVMATGHLMIDALGYWMIRVYDQSVRSKAVAANGRQ